MGKYVIGLDYGTLSARALLANADTGHSVATAEFVYPHGVMTDGLPNGWALQHPQDYLDALFTIIPQVMQKGGISPGWFPVRRMRRPPQAPGPSHSEAKPGRRQ